MKALKSANVLVEMYHVGALKNHTIRCEIQGFYDFDSFKSINTLLGTENRSNFVAKVGQVVNQRVRTFGI